MSFDESHALETYKSLISISAEALKALQWLNGGAVVVLLAYVGQHPKFADVARCSLLWFILGLVAATLTFGTSYLTQLSLYNESIRGARYTRWSHQIWLWLSFAAGLMAVVSFSVGAFSGLAAFGKVAQH